jgi:hypothetical protein
MKKWKEHTVLHLPTSQRVTNHSFRKANNKSMQINILTTYYALGAALQLAMSIHGISGHDHSVEIDHFQINVDQEVDVVSCYLLVDTRISLVCHSYLHHMLTSFGFRYYPNCTRR